MSEMLLRTHSSSPPPPRHSLSAANEWRRPGAPPLAHAASRFTSPLCKQSAIHISASRRVRGYLPAARREREDGSAPSRAHIDRASAPSPMFVRTVAREIRIIPAMVCMTRSRSCREGSLRCKTGEKGRDGGYLKGVILRANVR